MKSYKIIKEIPGYELGDVVGEQNISQLDPDSHPDRFMLLPNESGRRYSISGGFSTFSTNGMIYDTVGGEEYMKLGLFFKDSVQTTTYINLRKGIMALENKYGLPDKLETAFREYSIDGFEFNLVSIFDPIKYENGLQLNKNATLEEVDNMKSLINNYKNTLNNMYFNI